jgi:hypothetical protein
VAELRNLSNHRHETAETSLRVLESEGALFVPHSMYV